MRPTRVFSAAFGLFLFTVVFAGTTPLGAQTDRRESQSRVDPIPEEDDIPLKNWVVPAPAATFSADRRILPMSVPSAASHFIAIAPCRIVDTRNPIGPYGGPKLAGTRTFDIDNGPCAGIPATASAYSVNLTVTQTTVNGAYLTAWPTGYLQPGTATITWNEGLTLTNAAIIPAGAGGAIDVFAAAPTHLILDINGYFLEDLNSEIFFFVAGPLPRTLPPFNTRGGRLLVHFSGSAFRTTAAGAGLISVSLFIDGDFQGTSFVFANETQSHKALISVVRIVDAVPAGNHTIEIKQDPGTSSDGNDYFALTIIEKP